MSYTNTGKHANRAQYNDNYVNSTFTELKDCQSEMTLSMSISHLLVRLVKTDRKKIIKLDKVPQLAAISPETGKEFDPDRLYTYESESGPRAIQVCLIVRKYKLFESDYPLS